VRLRRPRDRSLGVDLSEDSRVGPNTPIAPPRVKRHSSMSGGRDSDHLNTGKEGMSQLNKEFIIYFLITIYFMI